MKEHERRYRSSIGTPRTRRSAKRPASKRVPNRATPQESPPKPSKMTYDEYLAETSDVEKILEIDEESRVEKLLDFAESYAKWTRAIRKKYAPVLARNTRVAVRRVKPFAAAALKRIRLVGDGINSRLDSYRRKYGSTNVNYSLFSVALLVGLALGLGLLRGGAPNPVTPEDRPRTPESGAVQGAETVEPSFTVITPEDVAQQSQVFFDSNLGVASFQDKLREHTFTISQQPLTEEQRADMGGELEIIAINLLAEVSFETQFGDTYLSNASPDGTTSQVVFFMTDELLVFIRTSGTSLSADEWSGYINSLSS